MSNSWEPCPRCNSNKVRTQGKIFWFFVPLFSGSCLVWIGFFFWPLWIFAVLLILISPFGFLLPKINQCQDCKFSWKVNKKKETMEINK